MENREKHSVFHYMMDKLCIDKNESETLLLDYFETIGCFNHTTFQPPTYLPEIIEPRVTNWFYFMINNVIVLLILGGNLTSLCVMIRYKEVRTVTNSFIMSLACSDLIMGGIYPLYNLLNYTTYVYQWNNIKFPCAFCLYCIILSAGVSNFSLLAVTIDRYLAIIHPFTYAVKVTHKRAGIGIVLLWIYILGASLTMIPVYGIDIEEYYKMSCSLLNLIPKWYFFGIIIPHMLIPNIISKILYCKILYVARRQANIIYNENRHIMGQNAVKKEHKATKTMAIILVLFFLCWAPYLILHIVIHSIGRSSPEVLFDALEIAKILSLSNSFINPLIYAWRNQDFRHGIKLRCGDWNKYSTPSSQSQSRSHSLTSAITNLNHI